MFLNMTFPKKKRLLISSYHKTNVTLTYAKARCCVAKMLAYNLKGFFFSKILQNAIP